MKILLQRVSEASVVIDDASIAHIGQGLLVFLAVVQGDTLTDVQWLSRKCAELRIFEDEIGKMNRSLLDINGEALIVSQFTLAANCHKGRRPSFDGAELPEVAEKHCEAFCQYMRNRGIKIQTGQFGAHMKITLTNDGPATFLLDSAAK